MAGWGNLRNWLSGDPKSHELREMREQWDETERLWRASPLSRTPISDFVIEIGRSVVSGADRVPNGVVLQALGELTEDILRQEDITAIEAEWDVIDGDAAIAVEVREMLVRRRRWAASFDRMYAATRRCLVTVWEAVFEALPEGAFTDTGEGREAFDVPLIELVDDPVSLIETLAFATYDDDTLKFELFRSLREQLVSNLLVASGFVPTTNPHTVSDRLISPARHKHTSPAELAQIYLAGTPFLSILELPIPFHVPDAARFEHCHIVGGTGHGKTQLMQRMIHADLVAALADGRSVVVIDSQGDLINKLVRLDLFTTEYPKSLADRLVLIDPSDVEFPASLNLFDAHLERSQTYRPVDRERVQNGVIELYEVFFGALLGAELTQKQGVVFKYLARLMLTIPGATIHTLMELMEDGKPFKPYMDELEGSARYFFETEFFHPSFAATKKQVLRRLWGVLAIPAFERMFAQRVNKLDLFEAMQGGKIILVSTAKDLLKEEGSQLFGRFFIAMLSQAALERSTIPEDERTPTFVYVDEAQEYFDDRIETILGQARKYRVAFHCAHQSLDQPPPRVRSSLLSNTSFKCVGGVSAKDARVLAPELRTSPDFIEEMRRRGDRTEFAIWLKHLTPHAIRLSVPLGYVERQPYLAEDDYAALMAQNRRRYCGTLADVGRMTPRLPAPVEVRRAEPPAPTTTAPPENVRHEHGAPPSDRPLEPLQSTAPERTARPSPVAPGSGKGGSQHRYVQHLLKQLAEERGFRALIEEAVDGGQIDVGLHRDDLSIACEISVTSTPDYEAQNLAKCLRAGFTRVWAIAGNQKRKRAIERAAEARLAPDDFLKVEFLTTEDAVHLMETLAATPMTETKVRGYTVKVTRKPVSPSEAKDRRATIASVISKSLQGLDGGET